MSASEERDSMVIVQTLMGTWDKESVPSTEQQKGIDSCWFVTIALSASLTPSANIVLASLEDMLMWCCSDCLLSATGAPSTSLVILSRVPIEHIPSVLSAFTKAAGSPGILFPVLVL